MITDPDLGIRVGRIRLSEGLVKSVAILTDTFEKLGVTQLLSLRYLYDQSAYELICICDNFDIQHVHFMMVELDVYSLKPGEECTSIPLYEWRREYDDRERCINTTCVRIRP